MKTKLLILIAVAMLSCKKESSVSKTETKPQTTKKRYAVNFHVPGFSVSTRKLGLKTSAVSLKDQIKYLHYSVYTSNYIDDNGPFISIQNQVADSTADFGTIRDSLPAGQYTILFAGGSTAPFKSLEIGHGGGEIPHPAITQGIPFGDSFGYALDITIGDQQVTQDIVLTRIVSKVNITITDAIPANAAKFVLTKVNSAPNYDLPEHGGQYPGHFNEWPDQVESFSLTPADIGKKNYTVSSFFYGGTDEYFYLSCYDANNKLIVVTKNLFSPTNNYETNKQYNFTGKLYTSNSSFQVTVDDQWGGTIDVPFSFNKHRSIK